MVLPGDPQDVGSVDEGRDAESRPPALPCALRVVPFVGFQESGALRGLEIAFVELCGTASSSRQSVRPRKKGKRKPL
jgi:hypothetical protein